MTIPTTGAIDFEGEIVAEFGGSRAHSISEYYRGGANIPSNSTTLGIPTSGEISFGDFRGASVTVNLTNHDISGTYSSGSATPGTGIRFTRDGRCYEVRRDFSVENLTEISSEWVSGSRSSTVGDRYEIKATVISGETPSGPTLGQFHTLNESRTWTVTDFFVDNDSVSTQLRIEIRDLATGTSMSDVSFVTITDTATEFR